MSDTDTVNALADRIGRVVLFPVRHHSPRAALLVRDLIDEVRPDAVLIEGPSDYNPQMAELLLNHTPPIAIYSFIRQAEKRSGVYYPMCDHSPEWQALRYGAERGATVRFIDMPFAAMRVQDAVDARSNRYGDFHLQRSRYFKLICERLGVDNFNDAWDTLFEIEPTINLDVYMLRCHHLCSQMRLVDGEVSSSDQARERYMAMRIQSAMDEFAGRIVVVTGGYHSLGLLQHLSALSPLSPGGRGAGGEGDLPPGERGEMERGIALTPYSFERLDALTGYNSGMPNPGFYHAHWLGLQHHHGSVHHTLTQRIVTELRNKKQLVSAADLIAAETNAQVLALLRGHAMVWRTDLVDGMTSAFIKDEFARGMSHPVLDAINAVLRGGARGQLAAGTSLPPLVTDIRNELNRLKLEPETIERHLKLNLEKHDDRERSRVLHRVRVLELAGFTLLH